MRSRSAFRFRAPVRDPVAALVCATAVMAGCGSPPRPVEPVPVPAPVRADAVLGREPTGRVEILWDRWGVPHIFAQDEVALLWAFGWAQAHSHGDLLLRLYGQARGRAAEYWGESHLDEDRWVWTNGIPGRAAEWLALQHPTIRAYIDAFAQGINAYAETHPERLDPDVRVVLPVSATDVLAHAQRVLHFSFVTHADAVTAMARAWQRGTPPPRPEPSGSNAWAIAPTRSASGHALLLANPHLPWTGRYTWYEAHLVVPGVDAHGAALVGLPLPNIAFNTRLGWTHTVNTHDGEDLYELRLVDGGHAWDGGVRRFETQSYTLRVRQDDGTLRDERLVVRRSIHGPVVAESGDRALALRVVGLDRPGFIEQTWAMLRAHNLEQFEAALAMLQLPTFSVVYADADGRILHTHNGLFPVRTDGDWRSWGGPIRGDTSATLWTAYHAYHELPRVIDPPSGWLQNANDPPWTTTFPPVLEPDRYPPTFAPRTPLAFRPLRSARMLTEDESISIDEMMRYKHSTRVEAADHILEDVSLAVRMYGTERARRAAAVLEQWDRHVDASSRGAILFEAFFRELMRTEWASGSPFDLPWRITSPLTTPDGLSEPRTAAQLLDAAAATVESQFGSLDIAWGEVHRLRRDGLDLPANGGPGATGVFRVVGFTPAEDGKRVGVSGDSWIAAIEFSDPARAYTLIPYGNASQPSSPHRADQLLLFARKTLRRVWRTRAEILANLEFREAY
ncbi:MAG: acylase [Gemmatimonadetes bacterium]|nr:acylase [Gemmatimonadota bacterium]